MGNHHFLASFIPHTATTHTVEMKFNGEVVPGSPWKCDILPPQNHPLTSSKKGLIKVHGLDSFAVGQTHSFDICAPGLRKEDIEINISGEFY